MNDEAPPGTPAGTPPDVTAGTLGAQRLAFGVRAVWRLARGIACVLGGASICAVVFPWIDAEARRRHVRDWSRRLLRRLGIALDVSGVAAPGPVLLVANHVSWLDILAIDAVEAVRFVSKADVRAWPVLGFMVASGGTLFIERDRRRDAVRVVHGVAEALRRGERIAVFPEGTTGEGREVLPFHANLLQAAIASEAPVQPVVLRYSDVGSAFSRQAAYLGETTLLASLWHVVQADALCAHVTFLEPIVSRASDRRRLTGDAREQIGRRLAEVGSSVSGASRRRG